MNVVNFVILGEILSKVGQKKVIYISRFRQLKNFQGSKTGNLKGFVVTLRWPYITPLLLLVFMHPN